MAKTSIRRKLTLSFLLLALVAIGLLGVYLSLWTDRYYVAQVKSDLASESRLAAGMSADLIARGPSVVDPLAKKIGHSLGHRVTIIRRDGLVLGDSSSNYRIMDRHDDRPEIRQAMESGFGWDIRYSKTLHTRMLYVATRIGGKDLTPGTARLATSLAEVDSARGRIHRVFFIAAFITFLIVGIMASRIAEGIARPIRTMTGIAERMAKGDFAYRAGSFVQGDGEIGELANTLDGMAAELRRKMDELLAEKAKLQAVLDKTDDGLLVVDHEACIHLANTAAALLLNADAPSIQGRTIIESTLNHDFSELVARVLKTGGPASLQIQLSDAHDTHLNVYVAPLERPDGPSGALVVMHDLTPAMRIDSVRRDFVANVSHEFRTPLASIKAMAETIVLRGRKNPDSAEEFAKKIMSEVDRLTALSEDLLDLAKIEAGRKLIHAEQFALAEVVGRIISDCAHRADSRAIELSMDVPDGLRVNADRDAVYQILANLVDNAVRYTRPGGKVSVSASEGVGLVKVKVSDTGIGIPESELSRIFERFYRVDKARSRESGGTGLGLSIVRHLVEAHGGRIEVHSTPGEGSTFVFSLPAGANEH